MLHRSIVIKLFPFIVSWKRGYVSAVIKTFLMNFWKFSINIEIIRQKKILDEERKNLKSENTTICLTIKAEVCEIRFKY